MTAAAFRATIHGLKTVPTRKVCQLTVEFPIEQLAQVALIAEHGAWVGIARLTEGKEGEDGASGSGDSVQRVSDLHGRDHVRTDAVATPPRLDSNASAGADKERRKFDELPPHQQAGILSSTYTFGRFLAERFVDEWHTAAYQLNRSPLIVSGDITAQCIRILCNVKSRADIKPDNVEFKSLLLAYRLWQNHPELEDA